MDSMRSAGFESLRRLQSPEPGGGLVQLGALVMVVPIVDALPHSGRLAAAVPLALLLAAAHVTLLSAPWLGSRMTLAIRVTGIAVTAGLCTWLSRDFGQGWSVGLLLGSLQCAYAFDTPRPAVGGIVALTFLSWVASPAESAGSGIVVFGCGVIAVLRRRLMVTIEELRQARTELADYAVIRERERFSRDLHDLLGHSLSTIVVTAQLAGRKAESDPAAARQAIADIEATGRTALTEVRQVVSGYRTMSLDDQLRAGAAALRTAGIAVRVESVERAGRRWPEDADNVLSWTVREAMTNILRHSHARNAVVTLSGEADLIRLRVRDDGDADEAALTRARRGLRTLRERIADHHGTVDLALADGGGLELTLELLIEEDETIP